jgi:RNA polymerase sigma-70 factor (ECF subfamily)
MLSFQDLYEEYAPDVYRFALWLTGDRTEAEDITSETFIRAWARVSSIRTETLKAYLFTIARNIFLGQQKRKKRHVSLRDIYSDPAQEPENQVESELEILRIREILKSLTEIDRAAFVLRVQQELPYVEIARVLDISVTSTKVKVHRVRKKIIAAFVDPEVYE